MHSSWTRLLLMSTNTNLPSANQRYEYGIYQYLVFQNGVFQIPEQAKHCLSYFLVPPTIKNRIERTANELNRHGYDEAIKKDRPTVNTHSKKSENKASWNVTKH